MLYKYTTTDIFAAVHVVKLNSACVTSSYRHVSEAIEYKSISAEQTHWAIPQITGMKSGYFARRSRKILFFTGDLKKKHIWWLSLNSYEAL